MGDAGRNTLREEIRIAVKEEISKALATSSCDPSPSTKEESVLGKDNTLTFEEFYRKREKARQEDFSSRQKKKVKYQNQGKEVKENKVEIKVGLAYCTKEGILKSRRGTTQIITVKLNASKDEILKIAFEKRTNFDQSFDDSVMYTLLYPDYSEVVYIPGTKERFSLSAYREASRKSRQTLYMIPSTELGKSFCI